MILKISWFLSFTVNFLKAVERNWKKNTFEGQVEIISEKVKKVGVHRYNPQNTADDRYQGRVKQAVYVKDKK